MADSHRENGRGPQRSGVTLDPARVRRALALRGMRAADLVIEADIDETTVTSLLKGSRVSARTAQRVAEAITRHPVVTGLEELLANEDDNDRHGGNGADRDVGHQAAGRVRHPLPRWSGSGIHGIHHS
jgi:hypothetical protein